MSVWLSLTTARCIPHSLRVCSMALTPFLAQFGGKLGQLLEKSDMKALQVGLLLLKT